MDQRFATSVVHTSNDRARHTMPTDRSRIWVEAASVVTHLDGQAGGIAGKRHGAPHRGAFVASVPQ